ncbi:hypothetical protein [Sinomonas mesophila]|uniref:hypothetical protein n=1 Tax=Sinomonas mesophila TaxID=1531955 RepID=UPI00098546DC|nr:hypothetical protein [Sinomonas mesophila]
MASGELGRQPSFHDPRDLTPFRGAQVYAPVRGFGRRLARRVSGRVRAPKLRRAAGRPERLVHAAVFGTDEPERLILAARAYPGWSGLCYVLAGLHAYRAHQHAQAAELLARGLNGTSEPAAAAFAAEYLRGLSHWIEVAEGVEVEVRFSEESVCLALAHSLREIGRPEDALTALAPLPPSLPAALASCRLAEVLGRPLDVVAWTAGLTNRDDLAAALLVLRARALRSLGRRGDAGTALREALRRRRTSFAVKNAAATERALLMLGVGRRTVRPWKAAQGGPTPGELRRADDSEAREAWLRDFERLTGDRG